MLATAIVAAALGGLAPAASADGYWLAGADGSIYPFGGAVDRGSLTGIALNQPVVCVASTPSGGSGRAGIRHLLHHTPKISRLLRLVDLPWLDPTRARSTSLATREVQPRASAILAAVALAAIKAGFA